MKDLLEKFLPLIEKLKDKKKIVIIVSSVLIVAIYLGVHYGYINESLVNVDSVIHSVENLFGNSTDSLPKPIVDTVQVVKDSL